MKTFEKRRDGIKEWESAGGYGMMIIKKSREEMRQKLDRLKEEKEMYEKDCRKVKGGEI